MPSVVDPRLLVGNETGDDASVIQLSADIATRWLADHDEYKTTVDALIFERMEANFHLVEAGLGGISQLTPLSRTSARTLYNKYIMEFLARLAPDFADGRCALKARPQHELNRAYLAAVRSEEPRLPDVVPTGNEGPPLTKSGDPAKAQAAGAVIEGRDIIGWIGDRKCEVPYLEAHRRVREKMGWPTAVLMAVWIDAIVHAKKNGGLKKTAAVFRPPWDWNHMYALYHMAITDGNDDDRAAYHHILRPLLERIESDLEEGQVITWMDGEGGTQELPVSEFFLMVGDMKWIQKASGTGYLMACPIAADQCLTVTTDDTDPAERLLFLPLLPDAVRVWTKEQWLSATKEDGKLTDCLLDYPPHLLTWEIAHAICTSMCALVLRFLCVAVKKYGSKDGFLAQCKADGCYLKFYQKLQYKSPYDYVACKFDVSYRLTKLLGSTGVDSGLDDASLESMPQSLRELLRQSMRLHQWLWEFAHLSDVEEAEMCRGCGPECATDVCEEFAEVLTNR